MIRMNRRKEEKKTPAEGSLHILGYIVFGIPKRAIAFENFFMTISAVMEFTGKTSNHFVVLSIIMKKYLF